MFKKIIIDSEELNYEINEKGIIRNFTTKKELKHKIKKDGYHEICLYNKNGKKIFKLIHRLVAENFIPNELNKKYVNHKDGNKDNNTAENLEWITCSENNKHAWEHNLNKPSVLRAVIQYDLDGNYIREFESVAEAYRATKAAKIREVANGTRKTSGGYKWKWKENFIPKDTGKKKKVAQYSLNMELIKIHNSISDAARETDSNRQGISYCCKNKQKTCNNFIWKYVKDDIVQ